MKKKFILAVMAGILALQSISVMAEEETSDKIDTMFSDGVNQLASNLYEEMDKKENLFFSPYSISVALTMLDLEAEGETKEQIEEVLGITDLEQWKAQMSEYMAESDREGAKVQTANAMWLSKNLKLAENAEEDVLIPLKDLFDSEIFQADIDKDNEKVLAQVNEWVSDKTEGMIDPFLEELPKDIVSLLVNAVYFEGKWTTPFDEELTRKKTFYGSEKESEVDMMTQSGLFVYVETEDYQAIQIPYGDGSVAMNILLPTDKDKPLEEWYQELGKDQNEIWDELNEADMAEMEVVRIPKFSIEYSIPDLDRMMQSLGMTAAYSDQADFSRLADEIQVDSMIHKAKLEVSEQYTKAAAATGIMSRLTSIMTEQPTAKFIADHPFVFAIEDTQNDMVLFMGQVTQL